MVIIICCLILPCGLKNTAYVETGFQVSLYISLCAFCVLIILSYPFSLSYRIVEGDKTILKIGHFKTYSQVPLQRGLIYHDITYGTAITVTESESVMRTTKDTLTGELCGVNCEDFEKIDRVITTPHCIMSRQRMWANWRPTLSDNRAATLSMLLLA